MTEGFICAEDVNCTVYVKLCNGHAVALRNRRGLLKAERVSYTERQIDI